MFASVDKKKSESLFCSY